MLKISEHPEETCRLDARSRVRSRAPSAAMSMALYGFGVAFGKGLSVLVLPFVARMMQPEEFARLDVTASFLEATGIVAGLAVGDLLFRFARAGDGDAEAQRRLAELLGVAALWAVIVALATQLVASPLTAAQPLRVTDAAFRMGLASAACTGLIELPLAWLRFRNRPMAFAALVCARSAALAGVMLLVLYFGGGASEVVSCNALIDITLALALFLSHARRFGIRPSAAMARNARRYAAPLVAGGLAMFGLGSLDRWFLQSAVDPAMLAQYALAAKLALATPLLIQPFLLWWLPRRIALTASPEGLETSARAVGFGAALLICAAAAVSLAGAVFVSVALPPAYQGAIAYLPALVLAAVLNEAVTLVNVGAFARTHGREVLLVNGVGGVSAVLFYALLIPSLGPWGAILATLAGHAVRLALFAAFGRNAAPIRYPVRTLLPLAAAAAGLVALSPNPAAPLAASMFACVATASLVLLALRLGLLPTPAALARGAFLSGALAPEASHARG